MGRWCFSAKVHEVLQFCELCVHSTNVSHQAGSFRANASAITFIFLVISKAPIALFLNTGKLSVLLGGHEAEFKFSNPVSRWKTQEKQNWRYQVCNPSWICPTLPYASGWLHPEFVMNFDALPFSSLEWCISRKCDSILFAGLNTSSLISLSTFVQKGIFAHNLRFVFDIPSPFYWRNMDCFASVKISRTIWEGEGPLHRRGRRLGDSAITTEHSQTERGIPP